MLTRFMASSIISMSVVACVARAETRVSLTPDWQAQPAERLAQPPDESRWASWGQRDWRGAPKDNPWKLEDPKQVNSLWLQKTLPVPEAWRGGRVLLDFARIAGDAVVFVNGEKIGERLRPSGEIEITKDVKFGADNQLRLFLSRNYTDISRPYEADWLRFTARKSDGNKTAHRWQFGITAPVDLICRPQPAALKDVLVECSWRKHQINLGLTVDAAAQAGRLRIEAIITDQDGKEVLRFQGQDFAVNHGVSQASVNSVWENPTTWEPDRGYLYNADIRLLCDGRQVDGLKTAFGFREVWTEGRTLYLNGHPCRFRMESNLFGVNAKSIPLLKLLGRNALYFQANPTGWWQDWSEIPFYSAAELDRLDRAGMLLLMEAPSVCHCRELLLDNPELEAQYRRETYDYIRRYWNHPSIIAWCVACNSFNPRDGIHPDTLGQRSNYTHTQAKAIAKALAIIKESDPTRLGYAHADGNLGDIATGNVYPNFAPVQEYEDWPEIWARKGDMPYFACEFAAPYDGSIFKGKQLLLTEYAAITLGDESYRRESIEQLKKTMALSVKHTLHGGDIKTIIPCSSLYWDLTRLLVTSTDRAWRTWGVHGWHYFNMNLGYGDPPGANINPIGRYLNIREDIGETPPSWVNPNFEIHRKNMQPLLAYVAGHPVHTDKSHDFFAGEKIEKQLAFVWDGPGAKKIRAEWAVDATDGKIHSSGVFEQTLSAGDIKLMPVAFTAPEVTVRTEMSLRLRVLEEGKETALDVFPLQVFPCAAAALKLKNRLLLLDMADRSTWVRQLCPDAVAMSPETKLKPGDILVVGRQALKRGDHFPCSPEKFAAGVKILMLEQAPEIWEGLGFASIETCPRDVFAVDAASPVMRGLSNPDLRYWRGSPDLLPEFKQYRGHDAPHAPKASNRNAVASCVLRIPQMVGFTPLLKAEFNLEYSPLTQWRDGHGVMLCSTLDLSGRVGVEPVPTLLAINLLRLLDEPSDVSKKTYCASSSQAAVLMDGLQAARSQQAQVMPGDVWVRLKGDADKDAKQVEDFVRQGGVALNLAFPAGNLRSDGFRLTEAEVFKADPPNGECFRNIGCDLTRWRDFLTVARFEPQGQTEGSMVSGDGLFLSRRIGKGVMLYVQVAPGLLEDKHPLGTDQREAAQLSVLALRRLVAQTLTNLGVEAAAPLARRVLTLKAGASFKTLGGWQILGPFPPESADLKQVMDTKLPGEDNAIAGDDNPNFNYQRKDGVTLNFRTTLSPDNNNFIDLGKALHSDKELTIAYATKTIESETERLAMLELNADWYLRAWVNGKIVLDLLGWPRPKSNRITVDLKKGSNVITLKVGAGSKGYGFWAKMAEPGTEDAIDSAAPLPGLYDTTLKLTDPYEYHYW